MDNFFLPFDDLTNPNCICEGLIDPGDKLCYSLGKGNKYGYEDLDERSPKVAQLLADVDGLSLDTVSARSLNSVHQLPDFIPVVTHYSHKLFQNFTPPYVAITIGDIVSRVNLRIKPDIRGRMGIPAASKIILLNYGPDELLENIWPAHSDLFKGLREAGVDLIVPPDFSIYHTHPHLERLFNIKRSLVVYQTLQDLGFEVIPHIYWSGRADVKRQANWINNNRSVDMVAMDLQTMDATEVALWIKTLNELREFVALINRPLKYLISGPQTPQRIKQIIAAVGTNVTFTNGSAAILAWNSRMINTRHYGFEKHLHIDFKKSSLFDINCHVYEQTIIRQKKDFAKEKLLESEINNPSFNKSIDKKFRPHQGKLQEKRSSVL